VLCATAPTAAVITCCCASFAAAAATPDTSTMQPPAARPTLPNTSAAFSETKRAATPVTCVTGPNASHVTQVSGSKRRGAGRSGEERGGAGRRLVWGRIWNAGCRGCTQKLAWALACSMWSSSLPAWPPSVLSILGSQPPPTLPVAPHEPPPPARCIAPWLPPQRPQPLVRTSERQL